MPLYFVIEFKSGMYPYCFLTQMEADHEGSCGVPVRGIEQKAHAMSVACRDSPTRKQATRMMLKVSTHDLLLQGRTQMKEKEAC
jgi:hypothetical protein